MGVVEPPRHPAYKAAGFTRRPKVFTLYGSYGSASFAPHAILEICAENYRIACGAKLAEP